MQITLDLPDDAFAVADAVAKRESRSLANVIADFVLGRADASSKPATAPEQRPPDYNPFLHRKLLPGFAELQARLVGGTDSTQIISEDRDER